MESASLTENSYLDALFEELDLSDDSVATFELSLAATALTQGKPAKDNGVALFKDLGVGDTRVGHVRVHTALAVPRGPRSGTPRYRLIVAELAITEGQVVHAALACRTGPESFQDDICDSLRSQYVSANNRCLSRGIQETVLWDYSRNWV